MALEREKFGLYIRIKWGLVTLIGLYLFIGYPLGVFPRNAALPALLALVIATLTSTLMTFSLRRTRTAPLLSHFSMISDLAIILVTLQLSGGAENSWLFLPVFIIFLAGYIFDLRTSLAYAALASLSVATIFFLEYRGFLPHFSLYQMPEIYWKNPTRYIGFATGMAILYFVGAFTSGYLNQIMQETMTSLKKSLAESKGAESQAQDSRKAMMNLMEDLGKARDDLELRVRERTAELEEAKANLEEKVSDRTAALENSRKAILHMMKDLKEDMNKLETIDRMKTEFLSMVSHELRTPLTPLKGYVKLLLGGKLGTVAQPQVNALHVLERQGDHLENLIDSLLDVSRLELGKPIPTKKEPISIKKVLEEVAEAMAISIDNRGLALQMDIPKTLPTILGDEIKIKRVLSNLLGNAMKFTPKGGKIQVRASSEGDQVRVAVIDNGIGIAKENLEKIFDKFYQVDSSYTRAAGGIGMGLSIARELVGLHGGKLWAECKGMGSGSSFIFTLPTTAANE